jgi:hypothetical protein
MSHMFLMRFLSRFLWNISFRKMHCATIIVYDIRKRNLKNLNIPIFHPIWMHFFFFTKCSSLWVINKPIKKMRYLWAITKNNIFLLCKMDYKGQQIPIFFIFGRFTQILLFTLIWHHFISLNWYWQDLHEVVFYLDCHKTGAGWSLCQLAVVVSCSSWLSPLLLFISTTDMTSLKDAIW